MQNQGLVPISADDIIKVGENWLAKITALIQRSEFFIVDIGTQNTIFELGLAMNNKSSYSKILLINEIGNPIPSSFQALPFMSRKQDPYENSDQIIQAITEWLDAVLTPMRITYEDEPKRLLQMKEYRASAISAISLLEINLRKKIGGLNFRQASSTSFSGLFQTALDNQFIDEEQFARLKHWVFLRNKAVHSNDIISAKEAKEIVAGVYQIIESVR